MESVPADAAPMPQAIKPDNPESLEGADKEKLDDFFSELEDLTGDDVNLQEHADNSASKDANKLSVELDETTELLHEYHGDATPQQMGVVLDHIANVFQTARNLDTFKLQHYHQTESIHTLLRSLASHLDKLSKDRWDKGQAQLEKGCEMALAKVRDYVKLVKSNEYGTTT